MIDFISFIILLNKGSGIKQVQTLDVLETLQKLVEIQKTDSGFDELDKARQGFLNEMAQDEAKVTSVKNQIQEQKKLQEELAKQRKTHEIEVGTIETKIKKYQSQETEVKSNEQFAALKAEVENGRVEKGRAEEKVLECLFKEDEQKAKIQELNSQLQQEEKRVAEGKKILQAKVQDCEKAIAEKKAERAKTLEALPPEYADKYERLRASGKKIAVARVQEDHTCSGCHMDVPPQVIIEIRNNREIQYCGCGRLLYVQE